jgi:hypothetical protein
MAWPKDFPRKIKHGHARRNGKRSPEYASWVGAKARTTNPNVRDWGHYGRRGIRMCERWLDSFENFLTDMGPKPSPRHSLDCIDNNGNYEPGNCRWATRGEQNANRRSGVLEFLNYWKKHGRPPP